MTFFDVTSRQYLDSESAYVHFRGQYKHAKAGCIDVPFTEFMSTFRRSADLLDYFEGRGLSLGCLDNSNNARYSNFNATARISALEVSIPKLVRVKGVVRIVCDNFVSPHIPQSCLS